LLSDRHADVRVLWLGREELPHRVEPPAALSRARELEPRAPERVCHNRQCHSARVVEASRTPVDADGLLTSESGLALSVFTADCVPVLLAAPGAVAALHAGWRGLAERIVATGAAQLAAHAGAPPHRLVAWIGPAIGACCYEVSEEVAERVAAAGAADVVLPHHPRPHLDLPGAARAQLEAAGVEDVRWLRHCTGCAPQRWWSHRRESGQAARNYALVWRTAAQG
jgi:YfiH family protein